MTYLKPLSMLEAEELLSQGCLVAGCTETVAGFVSSTTNADVVISSGGGGGKGWSSLETSSR